MAEKNLNYIGAIPPIEYFHPEYVKITTYTSKLEFTKYNELIKRHAEHVKKMW